MSETQIQPAKKRTEIPDWAVYTAIGFGILAAGAGTAYYVKCKRDEELKAARGVDLTFTSRRGLTTYWNWTVDAFSRANRFVRQLLKPESQTTNGSPLHSATDSDLAVYSEGEL